MFAADLNDGLAGIIGGFVVCVFKMGLNPDYFFRTVFESLVMTDLLSGLIKSVIFGTLICVISCYEGMRVSGGAQGVGRSTMQAVVASFILIVLADFFFTMFFYIVSF